MLRASHDRLAKIIHDHLERGTLATGEVVCKCGQTFATSRLYASHLAGTLDAALSDLIEQERVEAQLSVLAAGMRFWNPPGASATARSRSVYTGAQFAGWCREKAMALSRSRPADAGKPPPDRDRDLIIRDRKKAH